MTPGTVDSRVLLRDPVTRARVDKAIRVLHDRRIGNRAIGVALGVFVGVPMTGGQVRHRVKKLGLGERATNQKQGTR